MKMRDILIICIIMCFICSLSAVSAADLDVNNADNDILTTQDNVSVVSESNDLSSYSLPNTEETVLGDGDAGSFTDLKNLIDNDETGTVTLDKNYTYNADTDSDLASLGIPVASAKIIQGNGQNIVIDAKGLSKIFQLTGTVTLKDLTFINGYSDMRAAITADGTTTIENCIFKDNFGMNGGAIQSFGSLTVESSTFINNTAYNGGAISTATSPVATTIISNSQFINNTALTEGNGGSILVGGTQTRIDNVNITNSRAGAEGGAIMLSYRDTGRPPANVRLTNINIINATSARNGGAIMASGPVALMENITITDCTSGNGAGIFMRAIANRFNNITLTNNKATVNGGGMYFYPSDTTGVREGLHNSRFINNTANNYGGAIYIYGDNGKINTTEFVGNDASKGGAIYVDGHGWSIHDSTFTNNTATATSTVNGDGGAILWVGAQGSIDGCEFSGNNASYRGGAIYLDGSDSTYITNTDFTNNYAGVNGGAVDYHQDAHNGHLINATFTNNVANRSGGAVFWYGSLGIIQNVTFIDNSALGNVMYKNSYGINTTGGHGGAIMWTGTNGTIDNCTFISNDAKVNGGAIFMQGSVEGNCSNMHISNIICNDNFAGVNGGAVDWYKGAYNCTLENATFTNNIANRSGGAVFWFGHLGSIKNAVFTNNSALGNVMYENSFGVNTTGGHGGAIMWTGADGTIDNCTFVDNEAKVHGGAIFMQGSVEGNCSNMHISNIVCEDNFAGVNGGAVDWYKGAHDCTLENATFTNNIANRSGGAVFWFGQRGTIRNASFTNNSALGNVMYENSFGVNTTGGHGGAIMWTGADGTIDNCTFISNKAKVNGGAVFMQGSTEGNCSNLHISNVICEDNFAGVNGGAVDWYKGAYNCTLENATFTNNVANRSGGAVFWFGRLGSIKNAIFTNNSALGNVMYENSFGVNTTGGHGGAIMWTGADGTIDNCTFISNKAKVNGGAVFMQGSTEGNCSNMHINNIVCEDNFAGVNGGAVDWYKGAHDCILENATFENNVANRSGGAVYYYGVNGTIKNATFNNNKALGLANATSSYGYNTTGGDGGAVMWTGKDGKLLDSTFKANNASSSGGAIFLQGSVEGNCSNMTIDNCAFEDNYAGNQGGAVNWYKGAHDCTLSNSTFINNTAERSGGALYWYGENGTIKDSVFIGNNTAKGNILGLNPYGVNTTGGNGGAILWTGMNGNIDNCTFIKNNATNNGGAIYLQGSINGDCSNVTITKGTFIDNVAGKNGGAVDFYQGAKSGRVINSTFINNTAVTGNGGAIFWNGTDGQIINSSFNNNHARFDGGAVYIEGNNCLFANSTLDNNTAGDDGGAIFWTGQRGKMYNITANNNSGISKSDALDNSHSKGGTIIITGSNMAIDQLVVTNSFANEEAGGLFLTGNNVNLTNIYFANCSASTDGSAQNSTKGGAMEIIGNNTRIINATIENSLAEDGGGIYWSGHDGYAYNITATNNTAIEDGGALYISGDDCLINASTFTDNVAGDDGGAIYWKGNNGIIDESSFVHNIGTSTGKPSDPSTSKGGTISIIGNNTDIFNSNFSDSLTKNRGNENTGGAIFITGDDVDIEGCNFNNCTAEGADGGTIYIIGDRTILRNSNVTNSTARAGGAIYIEGDSAQIYDSSFDSNYAKSGNKYVEANLGGAIFIEGDYAIISGTNFTSSGAYQGGTIYLTGDYCYVIGSSFDDSYAEMDGGAMYSTGSYSSVYYCEFTNNSAQHDGGGIYWYGGSSSKYNSVVGCIFTDNVAYAKGSKTSSRTTFGGGALYWSEGGSYGTLRDSKFYNNSVQSDQKADGGAVLWDKSSHGIIDNCIFVGNYVTSTFSKTMDWVQGGALFLRARTNFTVSNCDFINSSSLSEAGAAYLAVTSKGTAAVPVEIYVVNTTFVNNVAKAYGDNINGGGAIQLKDADTVEVTFRNVTFINNTANKGGGMVVLNTGNNIKFYDCVFEGNNASEDAGGLWSNKAIYMYNTTFSDNYAGNNGGGLYSTDVIGYDNMTFINNTAYRGGGLYWNKASVTIRDMTFTNNTAYYGGAIYIPTSGVTVSDVNCTDNKAFSGSAIYSTTSFTLKDSYLMENQANSSWATSRLDYYPSNGTVELLFEGYDNYLNGIYVDGSNKLTCQNVIYWDGTVNNTGSSSRQLPVKSCPTPEAGQNFTIRIYDNDGNLLISHTDLTDLNGRISLRIADILPNLPDDQYDKLYVEAELTEEYYTAIEFTTRGPCEINASATSTTYHSNTTLSVNVSSGATGNVSVYLNDTFVCNITLDADSKGSINISTLLNGTYIPAGNHTLTFNYTGNYKYLPNTTTTILEIRKITPTLIVNVTEDAYCIDVNVTVIDEELDTCIPTGTVTLEIEGRIATVKLVDGKGSTRIAGMPIGNYTLNATYSGDNNYNSVFNSTDANITTKQQTVVYIDIDVRDIYWVNETVHINVTVFPNATGNVTLYLNGVPHNLTLVNSTASFDASDLIGGPNHILVTYNGDVDYAPSWGQASFYVLKFNATVGINTTNITLGDAEIINFTLPENATGILNVTINGTRHYVEIINGTATLPVYNLPVGVYNVTVIFNGDRYYYNATNSTLFNVSQIKPTIKIDVDNVTYGNETVIAVSLPDGATGNVTVKINDTYYVFDTQDLVGGRAVLPGVVLAAGNYTVEVTYSGDGNYTASTNRTKFTVYKAKPELYLAANVLDLTVEDIDYGENINITVTVPDGVTGEITLRINGTDKNITLPIVDGKVNWTVGGLAVGNYVIIANYSGNANYTNATVTSGVNVLPIGTVLDIDVHDVPIWDTEYINVTIKDAAGNVITNATGNVTIDIDGVEYTAEIKDGVARFNVSNLIVGHEFVWAFYDGDRNLTGSRARDNFYVTQRDPKVNVTAQNVTVDQKGKITINIPANATGYVVLSGNFTENPIYVYDFTDGVAEVTVDDLAVGTYSVHIKYYGDTFDNYTIAENDTTFNVGKINATVSIVADNVTYGNATTIVVTVPEGVTGNITLKLNDTTGRNITLPIEGGKVTWVVEGLAAGNYTVNATYNGNDDYNINDTESAKFKVKKADPGLEFIVSGTVHESATVQIKINDEIHGKVVNVTVDGVPYANVSVDDEFKTQVLNEIKPYTIIVEYGGNENFTSARVEQTFTPSKVFNYGFNVTAMNITVGEDEIITVEVPDNVDDVVIWVDGQEYRNNSFTNNKATFNITGLKEGIYTVTAQVNDTDFNHYNVTTLFTVNKTYPSINITVVNETSIYVNDTVKVIVTVPKDVTKNVTIEINGMQFTNSTVNGNATFYIPDITYGDKTVVATYVGDDKYRFNSTTANFTVNKRTPTIVVTTDGPIDVGDNITISVDVPANATGYVVVNVNGTNYTINITNGDYSVVVPGLRYGTWNVTATYIGDDQYLPNTNKTSFVVNKVDSTIAIDVESIDYGNKVNITVTVKDDATGYITIRINETRNITLPIDGGKVNWIVDNLAADNYTVYANYSGDDKYNENKTNKTFEVRQISPEIEIIRVISTADENATIIVKVDPRVTENVTVTVGGKPYSKAVDENGVAVITTDVLDYGTYTVTASYAGDKNFTIDSDTYEFTTNKTSDYSINITATDIKVGNNTNITVRVPADATGNVIIELNGTNYTAIINEDGIAVLNNISTLKEGVYNVTAYFGNDKYVNKTVSTRFVVSKVDAPIKVDVENLYVGDTAYINVTVPDDDTGSVTIEINGKVYGPESVTDGVARFAVPDVTYGNKTVAVTYSGTDKYVANFTTANFTVDKCTPVVNVTNITIIDGKDAVINIAGPSDRDANLIVTVDGVDYAVNMTNGNATLTVKGLSVDNYTVTVSYIENDKYVKATASGWVNVTAKGTSAIIIGVDEIYKVGDDIVITLTPVNSTGDVRVTINGKEYRINEGTVTITNGLPNGTYVIEAVLDEDDNYYGSSANATFRVVKNNITISISDITGDIVVDSPVTFTAELNESVTGDVIFTINGANYTVHVSDSNVATYEYTPVNNDTITVVATFMGNDKYNANVSAQKQFNVSKIATDINVTVKTPVTYGDDAVITVELNATLNTTAKLLVDGKEYDVALINGKGVFNASGLNSGDHEVNVTYVGDDKYAGSKDSTRFTVDNATLVPEVTAFNVTVEENTTFVINVTDDFNGNVSITVGDKLLYNGTVKTLINADKLPAGDKTATVVFYGDNNYDELTLDNVLFTVSRVTPTIEVTIDDVTYPDKAIAVINVGNAANGTVNVTVDGKVFNGTVTNGVANVDLTGLSAGSKVVDVEFFAGDDYNDNTTATAKFTVNKANSTIIIDVEKVYIYNDTIIINLTAKGSNGTVNVTINGKVYPINDEMQVLIENITAGEYTIIANLASDENCTAATNSTTFKVKQAGTNVTIDVESIYKVGDDIVITLSTVNSTDLAVTINGEVYTVTEDNTIVITGGLEAGDYIINAILSGNENYTGFNDTKSFTVVKNNITISVADVPGDIVVDTPVTFTANLNESVTGDVIFTINGANYTVHVSDSNVATYEYTPINNDTITVVATFTGNDKYNSNVSDSKAFNVNRLNSTITVKVDNITVGDVAAVNITVITGATGNVTITIGDEYNKTVGVTDGVISVIVPGLTVGDKTVNVTYNGNDKYLPSSNSTDFTVGQTSAGMNIVVENITYGEIETIIVFVNATGNVTIKLDGNEIETVNITDGKVEYPISGLDAGNYTVEVIYNGDANTNATSLNANFTVEKADPVISIEVEDITYGDVEYIIVHVNAEGNVTIKVNGKTVEEITLNNGNHVLKASRWDVPNYDGKATVEAYNLEAGKYPVEVTYNGNNNYNKATATASFNVIKDNTTVDVQIESSISVGETQVMNITIDNENATGNVTIIIDGKNYTANVTNGVANFTIPELPAGNHSVVVIYEGDKNLTGNWTSATFEVTKLTPEITVNATDITVGDKTLIEVTAPSDVTRPVLVDVDGVGYYVNITDGKCSIEVPISKEGTYNVTARYLGDDRYTEDRANNTFKASKVENPSINATVENITYGDSAVIKVSVPEDATGNVTITVNGTDYVVPVANGTATAVVPGLEPGNYTIDVVYNGDDKYGPSNTTAELTVSKTTTDDIEVIDQGNGTVVVVVGDNATGNVTVKVGNNTYTAEVINGTAVVTLDNETPGTHEIEVIYSGDDTHEGANTTSTVTIPKVETPISVEASDIKVGETAEVVVNVPDDAKGNVTIEIDGVKYTEEIKDGKAVFNIENLTAGNKTVYVDYVGDNNYTGNHTSAKFTVSKVTPEITLNVTADGDDLIIDVTAPEDATNPVLVDVNGVGYYVNVTDGKGQLVLPDVEGGKYDVTAKYPGDDKYYASDDVSKSVEVSDLPSFVTAEVADITYGEDAVIEISVPDDATGNVTVTIDNKTYTANVSGGKAVVTVLGLKAGNYSVDVSYSGDDKYMPSSNTTDLEVSKAEIDPADIKVIDQGNGTVVVVVPDNATGNVTIKVGNDTYTAEVINGTAVVTLENATPGTHEIEVIYSGDDNHEGANTTSEATIPKYPSEVSVDAPEITEGEPLVMTIEVPEGATGNVTVYIDGKEYPAEIKDGVAVVTVDNLTAGNKTFVVEYSGDDNFTGNYTIGNLTVKEGKAESEVTVVDQGNGTITVVVGDNATGNVTVKVGNNTYTAEVINGTAVITLDNETPGTHEIEVIYSGDDTHEGANATSTITVPKFETPISVDVTDTKVGDTTEIVVNVPEDATGNVTIEIDGVKYTTEIKDGKATFEIDNLTAGTKTVAVDYVGDNNYVGNHTTAKLTVSKVPSTVSATIEDSNVGDNVTVKITVPEDATGQVLVDIDGVGYYVNVTNGTGSVEIPRVPSGKYDVTVTYPGDDKYLSSSNKTSFNMNKLPSYVIPIAKDIAVGDTEKITFELPSDATGTITVTIDGEEFTIDLDTLGAIDSEGDKFTVAVADGKAVLTITDLPKGEYSVEVRYNGDDKYMPSTNSTKFTVSKTSTDMEITDEGDGTVKVVLPDDATGNVTIKVGNDTYTAEVINGTAIVNLTNTTPGTHEIEVVYSGDDKYASQKENSTVTVPKYNTPISVDVDDISAGDTAVITVTVPDDATGEVTIEINGKEYTAEIKNGKAVFEVSDLAAGDKTVAVKYAGDDNYVGNFTTGNFTVSKVDSTISATSKNIKVGKDEVITVTVPKDATGRVLVDIDGVGYYADIVNGMAKVIVPELPSAKYTAKVTYEGDDKYLPSTTTTKFTVTKNAAPISADGDEVKQGEDATVVVKVPSDATGTVTITVDGKKYTAQVENGKAVFVIPGLTKGDHDVTAVYSGDKKYDANDTITDIEVTYSDNPNPDPDPENGDQDVQNGGVDLSQHATGNPILMLLLILILIGSTQLRRFRK